MTPIRTLVATARRQHRIITLAQLRKLGLNREQIRHLVRTERIRSIHRGVYALNEPLSPAGWAMAAVLRCQPRAAATRLTAAALLRLREKWPGRPQVVTARPPSGKVLKGIDLHHSSTLTKRDITTARGIPVTSVTRTVIDCARILDDAGIKNLIRQAERLHRLDITELDRPGIPTGLRRVLKPYIATSGFTANDMEAAFFEICARAGLPLPDRQQQRGPYRVDFIWEDFKLVVETDGRQSHAIRTAFRDDRRRDRALVRRGYLPLRFTWAEIEFEPELVAGDLGEVIDRRSKDPAEWAR
jgi:very-short-patch-repair endonuclease